MKIMGVGMIVLNLIFWTSVDLDNELLLMIVLTLGIVPMGLFCIFGDFSGNHPGGSDHLGSVR